MTRRHFRPALWCLLALATNVSCEQPFEFGRPRDIDGKWGIATIDGRPFTAPVALPGRSDYLVSGYLVFNATDRSKSYQKGRVVARWNLGDAGGRPKPSKMLAGTFEFFDEERIVLRAANSPLPGSVSDVTMDFVGLVPAELLPRLVRVTLRHRS